MHVLDSYRSTPEAPEAGLAFDEFLRIGTQSEVFEATVLSAIAGVTVAVAARLGGPLRIWEVLFVAAGFTLIRMVRLSEFVPDAMSLLGTAVFGCTVWVAERRRAGSKAVARPFPSRSRRSVPCHQWLERLFR